MLNPQSYKTHCSHAQSWTVRVQDAHLVVTQQDKVVAELVITEQLDEQVSLRATKLPALMSESIAVLAFAVNGLFDNFNTVKTVAFSCQDSPELCRLLLKHGWLASADYVSIVWARRDMFRQLPDYWLLANQTTLMPLHYTVSDGKRHPVRAPYSNGEVYQRFVPELGQCFSLRTVEPTRDVDVFHAWQNNPRVAAFWEIPGTRQEHLDYLYKVTADPHLHPVIAYFDAQPFAYFEIYWAKEDRIAPFYQVDDYDRGVHMLVGEESMRGPHRVAAWLTSLAHYMFLSDPRTRHVVAEPRADNAKMIVYMMNAGFYRAKEFDFPHKRAALMVLSREAYFSQFCL